MQPLLIGTGIAILAIAISVGFIPISQDDYMRWRLIFASGEGLALAAGIMFVVAGMAGLQRF